MVAVQKEERMDKPRLLDLRLSVHAGGSMVDRKTVDLVKTPEGNGIWVPIPHDRLIDGVKGTLERAGLSVVQEKFALANDNARFFGIMQVCGGDGASESDYSLVVGLRNAHDKRFTAGLCCGSGVFVCDNLAFSGEVVIGRKHTTNINRDLPQLIQSAVGRLADMRLHQDQRISLYKETRLSDVRAHDFMIRAVDAQVLPITKVPRVLKEWREPAHDFGPKTGWRLFNAFTEVMKDSTIFERPKVTQALHGLMDVECKVA
jgi:hypothetical protein